MKSKKPINDAPDCREKNQINSKYNQDKSKVLSLQAYTMCYPYTM